VNEPLGSRPVRLRCYALGSLDVHGMKGLLSVLDVKTDRIYDAVSAGKRIRDRSLVVNIGRYGLKLRIIRADMSVSPIRMPGSKPTYISRAASAA
jgi:hypothetical protein